MSEIGIKISDDFSPFPAGRFEKDGPYTGEGFRKKILVPAFRDNDRVIIDLNGTIGYGSSFLEEAFGGLIREEGFTEEELLKKIDLKGKRKSIINTIFDYIHIAQQIKNGEM